MAFISANPLLYVVYAFNTLIWMLPVSTGGCSVNEFRLAPCTSLLLTPVFLASVNCKEIFLYFQKASRIYGVQDSMLNIATSS